MSKQQKNVHTFDLIPVPYCNVLSVSFTQYAIPYSSAENNMNRAEKNTEDRLNALRACIQIESSQ